MKIRGAWVGRAEQQRERAAGESPRLSGHDLAGQRSPGGQRNAQQREIDTAGCGVARFHSPWVALDKDRLAILMNRPGGARGRAPVKPPGPALQGRGANGSRLIASVAYASGSAAIAAVLGTVRSGEHVLIPDDVCARQHVVVSGGARTGPSSRLHPGSCRAARVADRAASGRGEDAAGPFHQHCHLVRD
jgi:hypothetical protein